LVPNLPGLGQRILAKGELLARKLRFRSQLVCQEQAKGRHSIRQHIGSVKQIPVGDRLRREEVLHAASGRAMLGGAG